MLTPVQNNAENADNRGNANNADDYKEVIGIALLKAFRCAKIGKE